MSRLIWGEEAERRYESGVDRGVIYPAGQLAMPWTGIVSVEETPSSELRSKYQDGQLMQSRLTNPAFSATIESFTYPEYLDRVPRRPVGFTYRTQTESGYKIHIVYNAIFTPSTKTSKMDEVDPFSWSLSSKPVRVPDARPTSHLVLETSVAHSDVLDAVERTLYGDIEEPTLPDIKDLIRIFDDYAIVKVYVSDDGIITVDGPDEAVSYLDATTVQIDWSSLLYINPVTCVISSL